MFRNVFLWIYILLYIASFGILLIAGQSLEELIAPLLIFGLGFTALAYVISCRSTPLFTPYPFAKQEWPVLISLVAFVSLFLATKSSLMALVVPEKSEQLHALINLLLKVLVFVAIPLSVYALRFGWKNLNFGLLPGFKVLTPGSIGIFLIMSLAALLMQSVLGQAAQPILRGEFSAWQLAVSLPLNYIWLIFEVGLVEEFFFRALLQTRLTAWSGSAVTGILLSTLAFGFVHVPGMYLRHAGVADGLTETPSLIITLAYSITTLSLVGIFLGILWAKTRNFWLIAMLHATIDLLPNTPDFIKIWKI